MKAMWLCAFLLFQHASPARAQDPSLVVGDGTIIGMVVDDASGEALIGASVSLHGLDLEAVSDASGVIRLATVPAGDVTARVEFDGYAAVVEQVEVLPNEIVLFQFRLNRIEVAVRGLLVRVRPGDAQGSSVTELRTGDRSRTALDLLREKLPGVMVRTSPGAGTGIRIRASSSLLFNDPAIYVDGILVGQSGALSAVHALEQLPAARVLRIRVLHGPSAAVRYGDSARGVILVETR